MQDRDDPNFEEILDGEELFEAEEFLPVPARQASESGTVPEILSEPGLLPEGDSPAASSRSSENQKYQLCPFCREQIQLGAVKCRYCDERIDGKCWRQGRVLVVDTKAKLPNRCVKTNQQTGERLRLTYYWHHPLIYLLVFQPLIYLIVVAMVRKQAVVDIGLSAEWLRYRRRIFIVGTLIILFGAAAFIFGINQFNHAIKMAEKERWLFAGIGILIASLATGIVVIQFGKPLKVKRIDDEQAFLKGACSAYLDELPEF